MSLFICTGNKGKLSEFRQSFSQFENVFGLKDICPPFQYLEPTENSDFFLTNAAIKLFSALKFLYQNRDQNVLPSKVSSILVDDSGLIVPQLNFLPGVHSAHFAGEPRSDQKNIDFLTSKIQTCSKARVSQDEMRLGAFFVCFLYSIEIQSWEDFHTLNDLDLSEAKIFHNDKTRSENISTMEKNLLGRVKLDTAGGALFEKIPISLFLPQFQDNIMLNLSYGFCCGEVSSHSQNLLPGEGHGYDPIFYPLTNLKKSFASIPLEEKNKLSHRAFAVHNLMKYIHIFNSKENS